MNTHEIYALVTNTIIEILESHHGSWNRPWIILDQDNDSARNPVTHNYYRGINQFLLSFAMMNKGYLKNMWLTYAQAKKGGGHVKAGEKSTPIIFYKTAFIDKDKRYYAPEKVKMMGFEESTSLGISSIPVIKLYRVFNVAQTDGLDPEFDEVVPHIALQDFEKDEAAENLIRCTGAKIEITHSNRAFYDPVSDKIKLPLREQFKGISENFYATSLHELGHWTGHPSRLKRQFGSSFDDPAYGKEELTAELISAFCCAHLGFTKTITNNAAYLKSWLGILRQDHKAILKISAAAQKGADYIIGGGEYAGFEQNYQQEIG